MQVEMRICTQFHLCCGQRYSVQLFTVLRQNMLGKENSLKNSQVLFNVLSKYLIYKMLCLKIPANVNDY